MDYGVDVLQKARNFIKDSTCINKCYRNLKFNHSCLRENVLPSFQFSPPIRSSRGFRLARKHGFDFLKLRITECHVTIKLKNLSCAKILEVLRQSISCNDFNSLLAYDRQKQHSISLKIMKLHEDKLNRLIQAKLSSKTKFSKQKERWVKNESKRILSFHEKKVLERGLNFVIAPKTLPVMSIASAVEKGLKPLGCSPSVDIARAKITQILSNWRPPTPNLTEEEFKALKQLQQDKTITILKSDKGNATVVMDKNDYEEKMLMLLADNKTYERIDSKINPLKSIEKELNKLLWKFVKEEKITSPVYSMLKCIKGVTPKIYGLPKVHKVNLPLRPIVAFVGSPTYNLSKFLINVLSPLLKQTYCVKNSAQFVNIVNDLRCNNSHCCVSFDVVSLFTFIPTSDVFMGCHV